MVSLTSSQNNSLIEFFYRETNIDKLILLIELPIVKAIKQFLDITS